jgi:hypothetical protein
MAMTRRSQLTIDATADISFWPGPNGELLACRHSNPPKQGTQISRIGISRTMISINAEPAPNGG